MKHIWVSKLTHQWVRQWLIALPVQAIMWTNDGLLLVGPMETKLNKIWIKTKQFSFKKIN